MEAISAGQTAAVVEELNTLLNAGNSPAALARQFVRYLRNALMARIGGESSDLLQISADERARAARSAMLFSEEDLTRFLQVMLRTFDDLNYRQEQRFHLELGLVKLVHLQRLLPVEELLSQLPPGSGTGSGTSMAGSGNLQRGSTAARPSATGPTRSFSSPAPDRSPVTSAPQSPASPRPSPFEADRSRKITGEAAGGAGGYSAPALRALSPAEPDASAISESGAPAAVGLAEPPPESSDDPLALASGTTSETPTESPASAPDLNSIREGIAAALAREGHETAANLIHQGVWTLQGKTIQVEVAVRKAMLALTLNAEAEAIARKVMRGMGAAEKIAFVPGENGSSRSGSAPTAGPIAGSAQSAALENPLVRKAQELFRAEIRSVLDLRDKL